MPHLRGLLDFNGSYHLVNREERNLAAILYHLLMKRENLEKFLQKVDCKHPISDWSMYFEYAFLRDLWNSIDKLPRNVQKENALKRQIILDLLNPDNSKFLATCSVRDFNAYFGGGKHPSPDYIQSPKTWSIIKFHTSISEQPHEFLKICKFKWAFNAKPDLVIHPSADKAICIEAKFESNEGAYPTNPAEKKIFQQLGIPLQNQTEVQEYLMRTLLGLDTQFVFLVKKKGEAKCADHKMITWSEAFAGLDCSGEAEFINLWISRVSNI
jgi:hypothetical protein